MLIFSNPRTLEHRAYWRRTVREQHGEKCEVSKICSRPRRRAGGALWLWGRGRQAKGRRRGCSLPCEWVFGPGSWGQARESPSYCVRPLGSCWPAPTVTGQGELSLLSYPSLNVYIDREESGLPVLGPCRGQATKLHILSASGCLGWAGGHVRCFDFFCRLC